MRITPLTTGLNETILRTPVKVPLLLNAQVLEPVAVLRCPELTVVGANTAASANYRERLGGVHLTDK